MMRQASKRSACDAKVWIHLDLLLDEGGVGCFKIARLRSGRASKESVCDDQALINLPVSSFRRKDHL